MKTIFSQNLTFLRAKKGLTLKQLGVVIGCSHSTVKSIENGFMNPSNKLKLALVRFFGDDILSEKLIFNKPNLIQKTLINGPGTPSSQIEPPTSNHSKFYHFIYPECAPRSFVENQPTPENYAGLVLNDDIKNVTRNYTPIRYCETTPSVGDMSLLLASPIFSASLKKMITWLEKA